MGDFLKIAFLTTFFYFKKIGNVKVTIEYMDM